MMYNKAILFNDTDSANKILKTNDVKKQKAIGRKVKNFKQEDWDRKKFDIIVKGNLLKFSQNEDIKEELVSNNKILVEASPYDRIYGIGLKYDNDLILDEKNWQGENLLGKALMKVRSKLKNNEVIKYNKLIRDKIPQVIESSNKKCEIYKEEDKSKLYKYYLKKIDEELIEVKDSKNKKELIEELADLSEALDCLINSLDLKEHVSKARIEKNNKRGSFSNLILKSVSFEKHEWFKYKNDDFNSCKKCGVIESDTNKNGACSGKVSVKLRELNENLKEGYKESLENKGLTSDQLKEKINKKVNLFKEVQGSILDAKEDIIAQGCNCAGASGAGIAKFIGKEYPESDKKYKELCRKKQFKLGSVMFNKEKGKVQAFCATQEYYGKFLKMDHESIEKRYQAIEECLSKIYKKAKEEKLSVALPRIGCGRARADWNKVKKIIQNIFHDIPVTIYWIPDRYSKK